MKTQADFKPDLLDESLAKKTTDQLQVLLLDLAKKVRTPLTFEISKLWCMKREELIDAIKNEMSKNFSVSASIEDIGVGSDVTHLPTKKAGRIEAIAEIPLRSGAIDVRYAVRFEDGTLRQHVAAEELRAVADDEGYDEEEGGIFIIEELQEFPERVKKLMEDASDYFSKMGISPDGEDILGFIMDALEDDAGVGPGVIDEKAVKKIMSQASVKTAGKVTVQNIFFEDPKDAEAVLKSLQGPKMPEHKAPMPMPGAKGPALDTDIADSLKKKPLPLENKQAPGEALEEKQKSGEMPKELPAPTPKASSIRMIRQAEETPSFEEWIKTHRAEVRRNWEDLKEQDPSITLKDVAKESYYKEFGKEASSVRMIRTADTLLGETVREIMEDQNTNFVRKPSKWDEVYKTVVLPEALMKKLPNVDGSGWDYPIDDAPNAPPAQYFIVFRDEGSYLVNTEGYEYARYVIKVEIEEPKTANDQPNIQRWYDHGMGTGSIQDKLVDEYGYTPGDASDLIQEIIYGSASKKTAAFSREFETKVREALEVVGFNIFDIDITYSGEGEGYVESTSPDFKVSKAIKALEAAGIAASDATSPQDYDRWYIAIKEGATSEAREVSEDPQVESIKDLARDVSGEVYEGYSGRGMYGDRCWGIAVHDPDEIKMRVREYGLPKPSVDNLGLDYIVYWPSVKYVTSSRIGLIRMAEDPLNPEPEKATPTTFKEYKKRPTEVPLENVEGRAAKDAQDAIDTLETQSSIKLATNKDEVISLLREGKEVIGVTQNVNDPGTWMLGKISDLREYEASGYWDVIDYFDSEGDADEAAELIAATEPNTVYIGVTDVRTSSVQRLIRLAEDPLNPEPEKATPTTFKEYKKRPTEVPSENVDTAPQASPEIVDAYNAYQQSQAHLERIKRLVQDAQAKMSTEITRVETEMGKADEIEKQQVALEKLARLVATAETKTAVLGDKVLALYEDTADVVQKATPIWERDKLLEKFGQEAAEYLDRAKRALEGKVIGESKTRQIREFPNIKKSSLDLGFIGELMDDLMGYIGLVDEVTNGL